MSAEPLPLRDNAAQVACAHCGTLTAPAEKGGPAFCCRGCAGAYALINGLGLSRYYEARDKAGPVGDSAPEESDWSEFAHATTKDCQEADLLVDGLHCAACLWLIERALQQQPGIRKARLSAATRRLSLAWEGAPQKLNDWASLVAKLGYRCQPLSEDAAQSLGQAEERSLLRYMAVAGFAAANIMLLSVSVWSGHAGEMGSATRDLFHLISGLIALPTIAYAGQPFFRSAWSALRQGRTNMDVPISIGVTLAAAVSLAELARSGPHAYFDAAVTLLFFLLLGRFLDLRARGHARRVAQNLLAWTARPASVITMQGIQQRPAQRVAMGERVLVAAGERVPVDGVIREGFSAVDASALNGESLPKPVQPGEQVFAGALNLDAPLTLEVTATGGNTLIGEIARLMEAAEQHRDRYVRLAERVARWYAPVVHLTAFLSFFGWVFIGGMDWRNAILISAAVLIITCPCALALAVPVVQVAASSRLMRAGILLKSASALERAAGIDTIVFDKTGTLTLGQPRLLGEDAQSVADLTLAASLAVKSHHPLCKALVAAAGPAMPLDNVEEVPGQGMRALTKNGEIRLGHARFAGVTLRAVDGCSELWLARPGQAPRRFRFRDSLRPDAARVLQDLRDKGYTISMLSGDHAAAVAETASLLNVSDWRAGLDPRQKAEAIRAFKAQGRRVLMVGDGLNDAVALAEADASLSPSSGLDIAQNAADAVFQGDRLGAVLDFLDTAQSSRRLAKENLGLALVYNLFAVPLAIAGFVTPLIAAIAMSSSSLLVVGNALRLSLRKARVSREIGA